MADHRITDFVDQKAIDRLKELRDEINAIKQAYIEAVTELSKGLTIQVKGFGDIEKLSQILVAAQGKAAAATEALVGNLSEQKKVVAETTATIQRQLAEQNKLDREVRQSKVDHEQVRSVLEKVNGTYDQRLKRLIDVQQAMAKNSAALKDLEKGYKKGLLTTDQYQQRVFALTKAQRELAQEKSTLTTRLKNEEREMNSVQGSYNHLSQELELLKKAYKDLTEEEKQEQFGKEMLATINQLDTELKHQAEDMGEYQRNVGNYAIAQGNVKKDLKEVVLELANLKLAYGQMSDAEKQSAEGQELAAHIEELTEKAGQLKDAIGDTNAAISNAASDTRSFDQISGGVQLLIDGFGMATGAAQMLGLSEDDLIEVQANLQAAIAASNALSSIQTSLQKETALMQGIYAIQTKAAAMAENMKTAAVGKGVVATKAATIAQRAFNLVAKANPYVLLATAIVTVVGALYAFSKGSKEAREEEERRQKQLEEAKQQQEDFKRAVVESAGAQIAMYLQMKRQWESLRTEMQKNKFIDETKEKWKALGKEIGNVNDMEKIFKDGTNGIVEAILKRAMIDAYKSRITKIGEQVADAIDANSGKNVTYRPVRGIEPGKTAVSGSNQGGNFTFGNLTPQELAAVQDQLTWHSYSFGAGGYNTITQEGIDKINQMRNDAALATAQRNRDKAMDDGLAKIDEYQKQIDAWTNDVNNIMGRLPGENVDPNGNNNPNGNNRPSAASELPEAKNEAELAEIILKIRKQSIDDRLDLEEVGTQEWLDLKKHAIELERQTELNSATKARDEAVKRVEESAAANIITEEQKSKMLIDIESNYREQVKAINQRALNEIESANEEMTAKHIEDLEEAAADEQALLDQTYQKDMLLLKQRYEESLAAAGNDAEARAKIEEDYRNDQMRLNEKYAVDTVKLQIDTLETILACETLIEDERESLEKKLAELKMKLQDAIADAHINENQREYESEKKLTDELEDEMEKRKALTQRWLQMSQQAFSEIANLASATYEAKIERIESEADKESEAADKEQERITELVEKKVISEEEGEARKRAAAAKTAQKQEELEKKKQQLKHKQALWDKANGIAQAGISTALAILNALQVKPYFPVGVAMAAMAAATGAVQIATILATPIPKYAKGTDYHKGGLAIVGDAGKQELISFGGQMYLTPDTPTIVDIPRGAEVIPDVKDMLPVLAEMPTEMPSILAQVIEANNTSAYNFVNLERRIERTNDLIGGLSSQVKQLARQQHQDAYYAQFQEYKQSKL